jgi:hypothetical protein
MAVLRQHAQAGAMVTGARPLSDPGFKEGDGMRRYMHGDHRPTRVGGPGRGLARVAAGAARLDRALPAPPQTSSIPAARWSAGQALVVVLIAMGALAFLDGMAASGGRHRTLVSGLGIAPVIGA